MNYIEIQQKLGKNIKLVRSRKKMTQNELATICDFEKASMSRIESGQTNPTIKTLYIISKALDVPLANLFMD